MRAKAAAVSADLVGFVIGACVGLPSLVYPYGRDQGLYFYVGRAMLAGALPYRDAFDQKPPAIYLVHAATIALLGPYQWATRVVELALVLALGLVVAAAIPRERAAQPGERGAVVALLSALYFTSLDFWHSAQVEVWEGASLVASLAFAMRARGRASFALAAGAAAGLAFSFKFTAALVALAPLALATLGARKEGGDRAAARAAAAFLLGASIVPAALAAWLLARGGAAAALDVLFGYNAFYAAHKPSSEWATEITTYWFSARGAWALALAAAFAYTHRRAAATTTLVGAVTLLAVASVVVQRKFYWYHWGVLIPFLALAAGLVVRATSRSPRQAMAFNLLALAVFATGPRWQWSDMDLPRHALRSLAFVTGRLPRGEFVRPFTGNHRYRYADNEAIGRAVRARARPGDRLLVAAFEPAIYQVARLAAPTRFFSNFALTDARLTYHRDAWRREYARDLLRAPPRFIVATVFDSLFQRQIERMGYRSTSVSGILILYERVG